MPFILLQMTSVFVGTVVFLLHSTNVNKKMEALKIENELLRSEIQDVLTQNSQLRSDLSIALANIERINEIALTNIERINRISSS